MVAWLAPKRSTKKNSSCSRTVSPFTPIVIVLDAWPGRDGQARERFHGVVSSARHHRQIDRVGVSPFPIHSQHGALPVVWGGEP